jgi:hypothetical protein
MSDLLDDTPDDWTLAQNVVFSRLFRHMIGNQAVFTHPDAAEIEPDHWRTVCWNASWMAASFINMEQVPFTHVDDDGNILGAEVPVGEMQ